MENYDAHSINDLRQYQALPLDIKIRMSMNRIRNWVNEYGEDNVCVAMTLSPEALVLLHLVHRNYPGVPAEFGGSENRKPMTAWMASEDRDGVDDWLSFGCNHYDAENPVGRPMSFWTKTDVLEYIRKEVNTDGS